MAGNLLTVQIVEILRRSSQGISEPFICRSDTGDLYYVKGRNAGRPDIINELLVGQLAQKIGLPIAPFSIVEVPEALIAANSALNADDLGSGLCFGSLYKEGTSELKITEANNLDINLKIRLFFFDRWIRNGDRTLTEHGGNPNLLWDASKENIYVIDHNLAFDNSVSLGELLKTHVFADVMSNLTQVSLLSDEIRSNFNNALSDWESIVEAIPEEWFFSYSDDTIRVPYDLNRVEATLRRIENEDFWE